MSEATSGHVGGIRAQINKFNMEGVIKISHEGKENMVELKPTLPPKALKNPALPAGALQYAVSLETIAVKRNALREVDGKPSSAMRVRARPPMKPQILNKPEIFSKSETEVRNGLGSVPENTSVKANDHGPPKGSPTEQKCPKSDPPVVFPKRNLVKKDEHSHFQQRTLQHVSQSSVEKTCENKENALPARSINRSSTILIGCDGKKYRLQKIQPVLGEPPEKPPFPRNIAIPVLEVDTAPSKVDFTSSGSDDPDVHEKQGTEEDQRQTDISLIPAMTEAEESQFEKSVTRDSEWYDDAETLHNDFQDENYDDINNRQQHEIYEEINTRS